MITVKTCDPGPDTLSCRNRISYRSKWLVLGGNSQYENHTPFTLNRNPLCRPFPPFLIRLWHISQTADDISIQILRKNSVALTWKNNHPIFFYHVTAAHMSHFSRYTLRWRHNEHDSVSNTSLTIVYSTIYSGADQSKHQSSASLAFVWGIHRDRWIPCTNGQ